MNDNEYSWHSLNGPYQKILSKTYDRRWFDYRSDSPIQCVCRYADAYQRCFKRSASRYKDYRLINAIVGIKETDIFQSTPFTLRGLIKGCATANGLTAPYDVYIDRAIDSFMRYRQQPRLPRPAELYHKIFLKQFDIYLNSSDRILQLPKDEYYLADNYVGDDEQKRFNKYLLKELVTTKMGYAYIRSGKHIKYLAPDFYTHLEKLLKKIYE